MKIKPLDLFLKTLVWVCASITFIVLIYLIGYILIKGVPHLSPSLFAFEYNSTNVSMLPSIITTIIMTGLCLLIAVPLGIFTAIFLTEYSGRGNKLVDLMRVATETLSGIPSIIYGLFGMLFFVKFLGFGFSILAGSLTLSIMILPLITRSAELALLDVPDNFREGSFGLGAGRLRTVFKIVLPSAVPGILAGVILASGRIIGETAALIYTAGTATKLPENILSSGRTLAVHMYSLSSEGLYTNEAYATAVVLLITVVIINTISAFIAKKLSPK